MVPPLGRALVPPRGLAMLGSRCLVLEGSRGDTWPAALCVPNATHKRLLVLGSQPQHVTKASTCITEANHNYGHARRVNRTLRCDACPLAIHSVSLQCPVTRQHSAAEPLQCQKTRQLGDMLRMGATWGNNRTGQFHAVEDIINYS
jgi:hypothetical protein